MTISSCLDYVMTRNEYWESLKNPKPPWHPNWFNAPVKVVHDRSRTGLSYRRELHPGGPVTGQFDGVVEQDENNRWLRIRVKPGGRFERLWIIFFCFLPMGVAPFLPPDKRGLVLFVGGFASFTVYTIATTLMNEHRRLGDYLVIDRDSGTIRLPRTRHTIPISSVVGVQWSLVQVGHQENAELVRDLSLLTNDPNETTRTVRYHVVTPADRQLVRTVADFLEVPVSDVRFGWSGGRGVDARSKYEKGKWISAETVLERDESESTTTK